MNLLHIKNNVVHSDVVSRINLNRKLTFVLVAPVLMAIPYTDPCRPCLFISSHILTSVLFLCTCCLVKAKFGRVS